MALTYQEMRRRAENFVNIHNEDSDERSEAQIFWRDFLNIFGVAVKDIATYEYNVKKFDGSQGFIDLFWKGKLVVEHKSKGKNLNKAFDQAMGYLDTLSSLEKPEYVIVSDFERIEITNLLRSKKIKLTLKDLPKNIDKFAFIFEEKNKYHEAQEELNIEASKIMGEIYDSLKELNYPEHELEILLIRILFCLYAEDTGIFQPYQFTDYIINDEKDPIDVGTKIHLLFSILNQPKNKRQKNLRNELNEFPFVNGKLFEVQITPPSFNYKIYINLKTACDFDWSTISPAIFGSLFQSVLNDDLRRNLGAHYTSEQNIMKVINALFMNDLWKEFYNAKGKPKILEDLRNKIADLKFFDPACGCGNFLIITYRELRLLEFEILKAFSNDKETQKRFNLESITNIKMNNFYGIEIEEFPSRIAEVAMWFTEHQMNLKYELLGLHEDNLPLHTPINIINGNALRMDWSDVLIPNNNTYLLGNPPFIGKNFQTKEQKEDVKAVFKGVKNARNLDYVTCWYIKAAKYIQNTNIQVAFVSTNSITQGEQASILWNELIDKYDVKINFAHRTFKWNTEDKGAANVFVVIIGFATYNRKQKFIFDYKSPNSDPLSIKTKNISPYLTQNNIKPINSRSTPIANVPKISFGSMPNDGGNLILSNQEKKKFLNKEPNAEKFIKPLLSAREYLNGSKRWCLWLKEANPSELKKLPRVMHRIDKVKEKRLQSKREATRNLADSPALFGEDRQPETDFILIPRVSSENRDYIPLSLYNKDNIISDSCLAVANANLYHFGILTSSMHMTWVKYTCGRLKGDYRYSNTIVYNNFPWPIKNSPKQINNIKNNAKNVLNIRNKFNSSLADLYNPNIMPSELKKAHNKLNQAVDKLYGKKFKNELKRIEFLFDLYIEYCNNNI